MSEFQSPVAIIGYPNESNLGEKRFKQEDRSEYQVPT